MVNVPSDILYGLAGWSVLSLLILIMIWRTTPAFLYLMAGLRGHKVCHIIMKDKTCQVVRRPMKNGMIDTKLGPFEVRPDAVYYSPQLKSNFMVMYEPYASTLEPEMVDAVSTMKEFGIDSIDMANEEENIDREFKVAGRTVRIHDINRWFRYNVSPAYLRAKIELEVADRMASVNQLLKNNPMIWVVVIVVLLVGGAIAWNILAQSGTIGGPGIDYDALADAIKG